MTFRSENAVVRDGFNGRSWRERSRKGTDDKHIRVTRHRNDGNAVYIAVGHSAYDMVELYLDEETTAWLVREILFGKVGDTYEA